MAGDDCLNSDSSIDLEDRPKPVKKFFCSDCNKGFTLKKNARRHKLIAHPSNEPIINVNFTCKICKEKFPKAYHLQKHHRENHGRDKPSKTYCCALCLQHFQKNNIFDHFQNEHYIQLEQEKLEFSNFEEFSDWKDTMQRKTLSNFKKESGTKIKSDVKRSYFTCHRSGNYEPSGKRLRHLKKQGSNKISAFCPASIKVKEQNGKCFVTFFKTHVGHQNDVQHVSLSLKERQYLATKLTSNLSFNAILDDIKDKTSSDSSLQRIHLLRKKDLHNIKRAFNLKPTNVRHSDDDFSMDSWVKGMENTENASFFKRKMSVSQTQDESDNDFGTITEEPLSEFVHLAQNITIVSSPSSLLHEKNILKQELIQFIDSLNIKDELEIVQNQFSSLKSTIYAMRSFKTTTFTPSIITTPVKSSTLHPNKNTQRKSVAAKRKKGSG